MVQVQNIDILTIQEPFVNSIYIEFIKGDWILKVAFCKLSLFLEFFGDQVKENKDIFVVHEKTFTISNRGGRNWF